MRIEKLNENTKKNLLDDLLKRSPNISAFWPDNLPLREQGIF